MSDLNRTGAPVTGQLGSTTGLAKAEETEELRLRRRMSSPAGPAPSILQTKTAYLSTYDHKTVHVSTRVWSMRNLSLAITGVALLASAINAPSAVAATGASAAPALASACGWPYAVNTDVLSKDSSYDISKPDTGAAYWVMPFKVEKGLRIKLSGRYPDSRYMSVEVYSSSESLFSEDGVSSSLADYRIAPGPGSANPWQQKTAPGGRFSVTLESPVVPGETNTPR